MENNNKNSRIAFLDYLRIMACFMVMVVHAVEPFYFDSGMNLHIATKSDAVWVALIDSAARACVPLFAAGLAIMAGGFYLRIPGGGTYPVHAPYAAAVDLEMSIEYCSLGVAAAAVALFLLARKFTADGAFYRRVVLPVSEASFGAYLIHILILVPVSSAFKGAMPTPVCVVAVAAVTFAASVAASCVLRRIPVAGKWLAG